MDEGPSLESTAIVLALLALLIAVMAYYGVH